MNAAGIERIGRALDRRVLAIAQDLLSTSASKEATTGSPVLARHADDVGAVLKRTAETAQRLAGRGGGEDAARAADALTSASQKLHTTALHADQHSTGGMWTDALRDVIDARRGTFRLAHYVDLHPGA